MQNLGGKPKDGKCSVNGPGPSHSQFRVLEDFDNESPSFEPVVAELKIKIQVLTGPAHRGTWSKGETSRRPCRKIIPRRARPKGTRARHNFRKRI